MQSLRYDETGSSGKVWRETTSSHPKRQKIMKLSAVQSSRLVPFPGRGCKFLGRKQRVSLRRVSAGFLLLPRPGTGRTGRRCRGPAGSRGGRQPPELPPELPPPDARAPSQLFPCASPAKKASETWSGFF